MIRRSCGSSTFRHITHLFLSGHYDKMITKIIVLSVYVGILFLIGILASHRVNSMSDYYLGGKNMEILSPSVDLFHTNDLNQESQESYLYTYFNLSESCRIHVR